MSLRLRLLLTLAPLFIIGLAAADAGTYVALQSSLLQGVDQQLADIQPGVLQVLQNPNQPPRQGGGVGQENSFPAGTYGEIVSASGAIFGGNLAGSYVGSSASHPEFPADITSATGASTVSGVGVWESYRVSVTPLVGPDGESAKLVVAVPLDGVDGVDGTLSTLLLFEIAISSGITIIVLVATWLVVRRGMRPLERMGATARSIAATGLGSRVSPSTEKTEVGRLGLALNEMLGQIERAFAERDVVEQRLRHFVSDASHELRTPLTSMRGYAELLQRTPDMSRDDVLLAVRRIEDETRRMGMLVDDLLLLARLDQRRPLDRAPVDLTSMINDAVSDARAADPGRTVIARITEPMVVTGDDLRLRQAIANLVRNALVHTPAGSPVEVSLQPQNGHAEIDVIDHGPGVPPEQRDRIFERFHRADPLRSRDQGGAASASASPRQLSTRTVDGSVSTTPRAAARRSGSSFPPGDLMSDQLLWYTTRGAGAVSLILLSAVVVLGLLARLRVEARGWPRFLSAAVHGDLALMTLVFLVLHIVTAVVDPFTHLGLVAAVVPFGSYYRTLWLGLGTIAFELLIAIVVTSLLRRHIGARTWRAIHWLAYASWPVAVLHGIGTGTDATTVWMIGIDVVCVAAVLIALAWRLAAAPPDPLAGERRDAAERASFGTGR